MLSPPQFNHDNKRSDKFVDAFMSFLASAVGFGIGLIIRIAVRH